MGPRSDQIAASAAAKDPNAGSDTKAQMRPGRQDRKISHFPRFPLFAIGGLIFFTIAATAFGRYTDIGTVRVETGQPISIRDLTFEDRDTGEIAVIDHRLGDTILMIAPGKGGFVRGTMRGLARERRRHGVMPEDGNPPFRLILWESGTLTLSDTATGQTRCAQRIRPEQFRCLQALSEDTDLAGAAPIDSAIPNHSAVREAQQ